MQAPPPTTRRRSPLMRYAPFIVIVIVIALIAVFVGGHKSSKSGPKVTTENSAAVTKSQLPITYDQAKAAGTTAKYHWQPTCDQSTGRVAIPILAAKVPKFRAGKALKDSVN